MVNITLFRSSFMFLILISTRSKAIVNGPCEHKDASHDPAGICVKFKDCKDPRPTGLPICGFEGLTPLVCCDKNNTASKAVAMMQSQPYIFMNYFDQTEQLESNNETVQKSNVIYLQSKVVNSPCEQLDSLGSGICVSIHDCEDIRPTGLPICGFNGSTPLVCCDKNNVTSNNELEVTESKPYIFQSDDTVTKQLYSNNVTVQKLKEINTRNTEINSPCNQSKDRGLCVLISECNDSRPTGLPICGFNGTTPLVCCTNFTAVTNKDEAENKPYIFTDFINIKQQNNNETLQERTENNLEKKSNISQNMCVRYTEEVTQNVTVLVVTPQGDLAVQVVPKCHYKNVPLILGGEEVGVGEYPHMVALGYGEDPDYEFYCGGSLISERYVMTAAHCTATTNFGDPVVARLGEHDLHSTEDGADAIDVDIAEIIIHPEYKPPQKYNDLALLRLAADIQFNSKIRPACLPVVSPPVENTEAVATGWRKIQYSEEISPVLLKAVIPLIEDTRCSHLWAGSVRVLTSSLPRGIDHKKMLCAGDLTYGDRDTCLGDSGGPLSIASPDNECMHYVIGVTSFGKYCGFRNSPGIYTRVSNYVPWIENIVWPQ